MLGRRTIVQASAGLTLLALGLATGLLWGER
jgi:hypothetical protein